MNWNSLNMSQKNELMQIYLKNGITSLDEMKKHYNSFAEGGSPDIPPERFFGIATPEVTDNNIYQSRIGMLPEVRVNTERPSWQHNLTDYDLARLRSGQISSETAKSIAEKRATGTSGFMKDVNKLAYIPNGAMTLAGAMSGALANPYLWGAFGLSSAAQNVEDKNYGEAALDVGLTFLGPELKLINKGVEATRFGKSARIASELNKAVKSTKLPNTIVENPAHNRFKLGDVELGDPSIAYRQGSQFMIDDFLSTGIVRSDGLGATAIHPKVEGKISLSKNFSNPMFRQGNLWYGIPEYGSHRIGLLTTREPLQVATKSSAPNRVFSDIAGTTDVQTFGLDAGRRIPLTKTQLNLENTTPYLYEPGYGYRRYLQEYIPTIEPSISDLFQVKGELQRTANRLGTNINHYYNNVISPEEFMKLQHSVLPISEDFIQPRYIPSGFPYGLKESKILMPYDKMRQNPLFAKYKDLPNNEFKEVMDDLVGSHEFIHYHNNRIRKNILNNKYNPNMSESQKHRLSYDGDKYFQGMSYPDGDYSNGYFLAGNGTEVNARLAQLYNIFNTNYLTPSELHIAKKFYPSSILDNDMTTFFNRINDEEAFLRTANDNVGLLYNNGGKIHIKPEKTKINSFSNKI